MAFITIPIVYVEEDPDDDLGKIKRKNKPPNVQQADLTINTSMIATVIGIDEVNHTMIGMADGNRYQCEWPRDKFEDTLSQVESIVDLGTISVQ